MQLKPYYVQVEVTTRCNFNCVFCVGRSYPNQRDMSLDTFMQLMDKHIAQYGNPTTLFLQGEGEPSLNKDLFKMAAWGKSIGAKVCTVTNGTYKHPERFIGLFDEIGLSIETFDEAKANALGRHNVQATAEQALFFKANGITTIINHVTGIDDAATAEILAWCRKHKLLYKGIPLVSKLDYVVVYPAMLKPKIRNPEGFNCVHVKNNSWRFYSIDGIELPCCQIKDLTKFVSVEHLQQAIGGDVRPQCCIGCNFS